MDRKRSLEQGCGLGYQADRNNGPAAYDVGITDIFNGIHCLFCKKEGRTLFGKHILSPNTCEASARYISLNCKYVKSGDITVIEEYKPKTKIEIILHESILPPPEPILKTLTKIQAID